MKYMSKRGFTLIELLVVMAIIGVLASVILPALNTARDKAADAAVMSNIDGVRKGSELVFESLGGTYGTSAFSAACNTTATAIPATHIFEDASILEYITAAVAVNGDVDAKCQADDTWFVLSVPLKTDPATSWCIDSAGDAFEINFANHTDGDATCVDADS